MVAGDKRKRTLKLNDEQSVVISQVSNRALGVHFKEVVMIEVASFPVSIRDSASQLLQLAQSPLALFLLAHLHPTNNVVGYLSAERLELFDDIPGVSQDSHFGLGDTVYLSSVAVLRPYRHQGIGMAMQKECLQLARHAGFKRVTAHVALGSLKRMRLVGRAIEAFSNWYGTEKTYEYIEIPLH